MSLYLFYTMVQKRQKWPKTHIKEGPANLPSAIELSETADFVCNFVTSVAYLTNFSFEFCHEVFTEDASLLLPDNGAKKSKMGKNSNQAGGGGVR